MIGNFLFYSFLVYFEHRVGLELPPPDGDSNLNVEELKLRLLTSICFGQTVVRTNNGSDKYTKLNRSRYKLEVESIKVG